jgi:amidase
MESVFGRVSIGAHAISHEADVSWNYDALGLMQTKDIFDAAVYSYGINYLGLPAGFVPVDLVEDLPAGVQVVGRRFREDVILDAMVAIEQCAGRLVERLWARSI